MRTSGALAANYPIYLCMETTAHLPRKTLTTVNLFALDSAPVVVVLPVVARAGQLARDPPARRGQSYHAPPISVHLAQDSRAFGCLFLCLSNKSGKHPKKVLDYGKHP